MRKYFSNPIAILILVLPGLVLFLVMVLYPLLMVITKSFTEWDGLNPAMFTGIQNYKKLFSDPIFGISVKNGLLFAGTQVVLQIPIATILALAVLSAGKHMKKFLRISYFVPTVLSVTVVCQLWMSLYNADYGLINKLFEAIGINYRQNWLSNSTTAIFAIAITNIWQFMGYQFILLFTSARSIPADYYEAATIDGCTKMRAHWAITIPLMQETFKYCLIIAITGGLNAFSTMYIMTGGGPGYETYTLTYQMYRSAFRMNQFGYGSASATVLILECLLVSIVINRLVARERIVY
ncbi:sugar ABC transporter permease [Lachnospiraceae bacterium ZAX-1]